MMQAPEGRRIRAALLLIDFQQAHRRSFSYEHGTLEEGIFRTASLITEAKSSGCPIIIVSGKVTREVFPEIAEAAGPGAIKIHKRSMSAFSEPGLIGILKAHGADTVVLCGWIRHLCVMASAAEALESGFSIRTSDEVLFGNRELGNPQARKMALGYFARMGRLFETAEELGRGLINDGLRGI